MNKKGTERPLHIAIVSDHLKGLTGQGGGVDRCQWRLAREYARRGFNVDMVVFNDHGLDRVQFPQNISLNVIQSKNRFSTKLGVLRHCKVKALGLAMRPLLLPLRPNGRLRFIGGMANYLRRAKPDLLVSGGTYENLISIIAAQSVSPSTRVLVSERNPLSQTLKQKDHAKRWRWKYLPPLLSYYYARATATIAISETLATDLDRVLRLPKDNVRVAYNPVIDDDALRKIQEPLDHPWFRVDEPPVILWVGRFQPQKDLQTLIRGFDKARQQRPMRLLLLGDGPDRPEIEAEIRSRGLESIVSAPGYEANPLRYMAAARLFVLSSRYEGLPGALIEALAAGCPVISTDCPGSSREILNDGEYGALTPVADPDGLANAILEVLRTYPVDQDRLRKRGRCFTVQQSAEDYLKAAGFSPSGN